MDKMDVAFGDTWADIPLAQHAARPIAIYADTGLKATDWNEAGKSLATEIPSA